MTESPKRKQPDETQIWKAAFAAATTSLEESKLFTPAQLNALSKAIAHAVFMGIVKFTENIASTPE